MNNKLLYCNICDCKCIHVITSTNFCNHKCNKKLKNNNYQIPTCKTVDTKASQLSPTCKSKTILDSIDTKLDEQVDFLQNQLQKILAPFFRLP